MYNTIKKATKVHDKKRGVPTHQPQSHHYIPAGQWDFYFFYHLQHMYSFPTYRKPLASMLTGQGLCPQPLVYKPKTDYKEEKKTARKPEYKYTINE